MLLCGGILFYHENRTATRLVRGISDRTMTNAEVLRDVNAALSLTTLLVVAESAASPSSRSPLRGAPSLSTN